jgi:hypothetical protein
VVLLFAISWVLRADADRWKPDGWTLACGFVAVAVAVAAAWMGGELVECLGIRGRYRSQHRCAELGDPQTRGRLGVRHSGRSETGAVLASWTSFAEPTTGGGCHW